MHVNTLADSEASISAACTEVVFVNVRFCALTADGNNEGPIDCGPVEGDEFLHAVIDYIRREYMSLGAESLMGATLSIRTEVSSIKWLFD
eukprot:6213823-Pleurochrysis_carterae.AAC.5